MRIISALVFIMLAAALFTGTAQAQPDIDVNVGYVIPTGDFADAATPGFGIGADVFFGLPMFPVELGGRLAYNRFGAEDEFEDGHTSIIEILPSVRYIFGPPLSPVKVFGQLGVGIYSWENEFEFKGISQTIEDDDSDFGIAVGAGVRGKLGPLTGIMAMPMYHVIFTEEDNTTYLSLDVGLVF